MRAIVLSLVITSGVVFAQAPTGPTFATVSIKRSWVSGVGFSWSLTPDGGLQAVGASLDVLLASAYSVSPFDVVGLPAWSRVETYDITATSSLSDIATPNERAAMLRAMLADRFKFVAHLDQGHLVIDRVESPFTNGEPLHVLMIDGGSLPLEPAVG